MRNMQLDRRAGSRSISMLRLTWLVGTTSVWRVREAWHWWVKSSPKVLAHGDSVPHCQHHGSYGLCWLGSGRRGGGGPPQSSRCAWHLLGLCLGCRRLLVLPQQDLEEVCVKTGGWGKQQQAKMAPGLHGSPCSAPADIWFPSPSLFPAMQTESPKWVVQAIELARGKCEAL